MLPTHSLLAYYWHFLRPYRWGVAFVLIAPCALVIETAYIPYVTRNAVNLMVEGVIPPEQLWHHLQPILLPALTAYGFMLIMFRLQEMFANRILPATHAGIRLESYAYIARHSHQFFSEQFAGSVANKIGDLARAFQTLFFFTQWQIIATLSVLIVSLALMANISPLITGALAAWTLVHLGITLITARSVTERSAKLSEARSTLSGAIVDSLSNIASVRYFAANQTEQSHIAERQSIERACHQDALTRITQIRALQDIAIMIVLTIVGYQMIEGWRLGLFAAGDFVYIFFATLNVLFFVWHNSAQIPTFFADMGMACKALELLRAPHGLADRKNATELYVTQGEIRFESVSFSYSESLRLFCNRSLRIPAGQKVGLVGFSGSGKSSFVNLILRLYDVSQGSILIDNQDIAAVTQDSLHRAIAFIPQDTSLFHRSLMENIRYGRSEATNEEVIAASKAAYCHEFIASLPLGYDTLVGERGVKLSGGQRQRIAIARAILKNAPILILDEATSSLDSVTEHYIQQSLSGLMRGRTTILIAHRLSTLSAMDRILVFDAGEVIEDGNHETLLAQNGHYAALWNMQTQGQCPEL